MAILWKITHAINIKVLTNNNPSAKMEMFSTFEERRFSIVERLVFSLKPYQTVYRGMFYRKTHIQERLVLYRTYYEIVSTGLFYGK